MPFSAQAPPAFSISLPLSQAALETPAVKTPKKSTSSLRMLRKVTSFVFW